MPRAPDRRERELFEAARELSGEDREALLQETSAQSPEVAARVRRLLEAHPPLTTTRPLPTGPPEEPAYPERIGSYHLLEQIGAGGMGVVYVAEQAEPVRRKVALKLIKAGMDTREVIARFHSERQALALMNHPNIARILEAGATELGHPFFVMEYVPGMPLLDYCDRQNLDVTRRLRLFVDVCDAVQHAHQKGVIHRDLKPSNILIKEEDGQQIPKVIDFGVAKAVGQRLSELTVHTRLGGFLGTPEYVSPEQAKLTGLDVDTRADVYSLGAVLYELLTGVRPFDFSAPGLSLIEIQQTIFEQDPPLLSAQAQSGGEGAQQRAEKRRTDPSSLARTLRHDLEWIVMKALEKDRNRRYSGASELAADIERFLANQPVAAGPRSAAYRLRRFGRRHRALLSAGTLGFLLLIAGIVGTTSGLLQARREAERARVQTAIANEINNFLNEDLLAAVTPERQGIEVSMRQVLDTASQRIEGRFTTQPLVEASLRQTIGRTYEELGYFAAAEPHLKRTAAIFDEVHGPEHRETLKARYHLGTLYREQGRHTAAEPLQKEVLEARRRLLGDQDPETLDSMAGLAILYTALGRYPDSEALFLECIASRELLWGRADPRTTSAIETLAILYQYMHRWQEAERLQLEAIENYRRTEGEEGASTLNGAINLSALYLRQERYDEAEEVLSASLAPMRRVMGEEHPQTLMMANNLGYLYTQQGRFAEAEELLLDNLEIKRRVLGSDHPSTAEAVDSLVDLYSKRNAAGPLAKYAREHIEVRRRLAEAPGASPRDQHTYAALLLTVEPVTLRDPATALEFALAAEQATEGGDARTLATLARAYFETGDAERAVGTVQQALEIAPDGSSALREQLERALDRYRQAVGR